MAEQSFPSWRYGPGGEARVCGDADDVPPGWVDHPSKLKTPATAKDDAPKPARRKRA